MSTSVSDYLLIGCGRCSLGGTPDCKVHEWSNGLQYLMRLARKSELTEASKWGVPCYTLNGKNVLLISAFKDFCSIHFMKGILLKDPNKRLEQLGQHSQSSMLLKFTDANQIQAIETEIESFISQAIAVEKAGLKVDFKKRPEPIPEELETKFAEDPVFKAAFEGLTPGRQRGYILFISGAKQTKTRQARIDKWVPTILKGEGMHDAFKRRKP